MKPLHFPKPHHLSVCHGKRSFPTMALAKHRNRLSDKPRNAYKCSCCGSYHLGAKGDDIGKENPRQKRLRLKGWQAEETIVRALRQRENS